MMIHTKIDQQMDPRLQYAIARHQLRAGTSSCGTQQQTTSPFACAPGRRRVPPAHMRRVLGSMVLGLVVVAGSGFMVPASATPLKDALAKLQGRYEATKTMEADFKQTVESPTLATPLKTSGKVAFEKPNHMRWDYDPPDKQTIVGDGQSLWVFQHDMNQIIKKQLHRELISKLDLNMLEGMDEHQRRA